MLFKTHDQPVEGDRQQGDVAVGEPVLATRGALPVEGDPDLPAPVATRVTSRDVAALVGLVLLLAVLWGRAAGVWFWVDEGMSVGISSHALSAIPHLLTHDGSPPLYYVLLHAWMAVFGSSEPATHLLSLLAALATVPVGLWAGWSLRDRRTGWILAVLLGLNPFLATYANETRMYSLVVLFGLLTVATFAHAFVLRRRHYVPAFALSLTLLAYTHNWGLLLGVGAGVALMVCAFTSPEPRRVLLDGVLAFGAVAVAYLPWVPTLLTQIAHTGAPFSQPPTLERARSDILAVFGDPVAVVALGLGAGAALVGILRPPWDRRSLGIVVATVIPSVALAVGWLFSRQDSAWQVRYLAVIVGPVLLVLAAGLAGGGRGAVAALAIYGMLAGPIAVKHPRTEKSDIKVVADRLGPTLRPGDLVVTDFGRVPVLAYYFPPGLRYAESTGLVADERASDQSDGTARLRQSDPTRTVKPLLDTVAPGGHVAVICPAMAYLKPDDTEFVQLIYRRCQESKAVVAADPRFRLDDHRDTDAGIDTIYAPVTSDLFTRI
ncbi:MAG: hypothetical protein ABR511_14625 [Acidimicrobiales bacterium]